MEYTFEAGGHTFCIPNTDDFSQAELATLQGYVTLALEKQHEGTLRAPSFPQVLDWVIASGMTKIRSKNSETLIAQAVRFLFGRGLLARVKGHPRGGRYWPTLLDIQGVPRPEFLREETGTRP